LSDKNTPSLVRLRQVVKVQISRIKTLREGKEVTVEFEYDLAGNRTNATINDTREIRYIDYFCPFGDSGYRASNLDND